MPNIAAPLDLGQYYDATSTASHYLGMEYWFRDPYSGGKNLYQLVKNSATIALAPKRGVIYKSGSLFKEVDGYNLTVNSRVAGIVDENLPSGGVPVGYLFWILRKGLGLCTSGLAADATNVLTVNDPLLGLTSAASTSTTAGRFGTPDYAVTEQFLAKLVYNRAGRAQSAKTTANTAADVLGEFDFTR